jgi:hypothetical protein
MDNYSGVVRARKAAGICGRLITPAIYEYAT